MSTIFEAIREDHDVQRNLLEQLVKTSGDSTSRKMLFEQLKKELAEHSNAEERHFYKPLISDDSMQEHARHGIAEHHEIDELIEQLEVTDLDSSAWLKIAKNLKDKVEHHLIDEERTFFQMAGKVFSEREKSQLAEQYTGYMSEHRA